MKCLSRQVYEAILGIQNEIPIFYPACGLLLRDDLHHAFDRLEFSFHVKVGDIPPVSSTVY
jgi:hypothetical protein